MNYTNLNQTRQEIEYAIYRASRSSNPRPAVIREIKSPIRVIFDPLKVRRYTTYKEMWEAISRLQQRVDYLEERIIRHTNTLDDIAHKW
jgi:hypothetical protein